MDLHYMRMGIYLKKVYVHADNSRVAPIGQIFSWQTFGECHIVYSMMLVRP